MKLFDSLNMQKLIGSLGHRLRDAKDLQRKTTSICPHGCGPIHFHMLILDGVYVYRLDGQLDFTGSVRRPLNLLWVFETGRPL